MSDISTIVKDELGDLLKSINVNVEDILDGDIENAYEEEIGKWNSIDKKYLQEFNIETDSIKQDFDIARNLILKTMDKSEKLMDEFFKHVAVKPTPIMLEAGQEAVKSVQQNVKTLVELHKLYQEIESKKIKNDREKGNTNPEEEKKDVDANGNELQFGGL